MSGQNPSNPQSKDPPRDPTTATLFPRCTATDTRWRELIAVIIIKFLT